MTQIALTDEVVTDFLEFNINSSQNEYGTANSVSATKQRLKIAYAIQNVGGIDFSQDVGDTVPVKQSLLGLQRAGHEVRCFQLKDRGVLQYDDLSDIRKVLKTPLKITGSAPFLKFESAVRRTQKLLRLPYFAFLDTYRFYEACYQNFPAFDLCHEHNGLFCIGAALACRKLSIPYILTFSADLLLERALVGKPLKGLHARIAATEARFTYKFAKKILCVSEAARRHLIDTWQVDPEKIAVMPNGVDINLFKPTNAQSDDLRHELGLNGSQIITFVGGFQPWHGLDLLVESFAMLLKEIPTAKLLLVGDGRARPDVEKSIQKFGIAPNVMITGFLPQGRIPAFLSIADLAIMPYPQLPKELWFSPLKMYEYMSAGKAIVASRAGQIAEVIEDGYNGVLVEPGNTGSLTQTMIRLLKDEKERNRLGMNARQQAVEKHSWDRYVSRLETIYMSALEPSLAKPA